MKIDRIKLKKAPCDVPEDCKALIDRLKKATFDELLFELVTFNTWTFGKCELYNWIEVLDIFDEILESSCDKRANQWCLLVDFPEQSMYGENRCCQDRKDKYCRKYGENCCCQERKEKYCRKLKELLLQVLRFTALLIEHSSSRNFYNSMEHLTTLLSSTDMDVVLGVLNLLYVFSKRSNFITKLNPERRQLLLWRLIYLAESWGGKENGFGLAECCQNLPMNVYPSSASTLHFEFYIETEDKNLKKGQTICCIHIENVDQIRKTPAQIMEDLIEKYSVQNDKQMQLFTHLRLAHSFPDYPKRLLCVQARLQAISILVYCNAVPDNVSCLVYNGLIEELVDVLELQAKALIEIKAAALRTMTAIIHLDRNPKLNAIIEATGAASYHGFLPALVRNCIQSLVDPDVSAFPLPYVTAVFSFLYHLASYESGGEALVSCAMMEALLDVINWHKTELEHLSFVTRAVRVIDLITNLDMQAFQSLSGLSAFIKRIKVEIDMCRREDYDLMGSLNMHDSSGDLSSSNSTIEINSESSSSSSSNHGQSEVLAPMDLESPFPDDLWPTEPSEPGSLRIAEVYSLASNDTDIDSSDLIIPENISPVDNDTQQDSHNACDASGSSFMMMSGTKKKRTLGGAYCLPQRTALLKAMLNFIKKSISDPVFSDSIRHLMDGSLPDSLKDIISRVEYYGSPIFFVAIDVVAVYIFQEPTLLCTLQDIQLTDVILEALLKKELFYFQIPPAREVLSSLSNIFGALCLNRRGLQSFMAHKPFETLFKVLISKKYLPAMCQRHTSDASGDTATNLGNAMDELMRHQPSLRTDATIAIVKLLEEICELGRSPQYVCAHRYFKEKSASDNAGPNDGSSDEDDIDQLIMETRPSPYLTEGFYKGIKTTVPLLDYIYNVMRFVDAILSNNSTDDHCREFVSQKGLVPLMTVLGLPNLPLHFSKGVTCQAVASVCKSILNLAHEPQVLRQGLLHLNEVLENLEPLHRPLDPPGGSVLLEETINHFKNTDQKSILYEHLAAARSYVMMFIHICRTGQSDIRIMSLNHWGSELGLDVLRGLSKLYTSLVWESTVLLALCSSDNASTSENQFGLHQLERLASKHPPRIFKAGAQRKNSKQEINSNVTSAMKALSTSSSLNDMDSDEECYCSASEEPDCNPLDETNKSKSDLWKIKVLKSRLNASSALGRSLGELFCLLVKLCVGTPMRQRRGQQIQQTFSHTTPTARSVANAIATLLADGLSWEPPPIPPILKFRLTFNSCSVGFTSPMLFDDRKYPYHLMLEMFVQRGAQDAFFKTFHWALTCGERVSIELGLEHPELPDGTGEFLDAWLMLLEKMVNPKTVLDSPHMLPSKPAHLRIHGTDFEPAQYLLDTQKRAFKSIMCLWNRKPLAVYGERMVESILTILCHMIKGENTLQEKISKIKEETVHPVVPPTPPVSHLSSSINPNVTLACLNNMAANRDDSPPPQPRRQHEDEHVNQEHLGQLIDMGFPRFMATAALSNTASLEQATDYILNFPGIILPSLKEESQPKPEVRVDEPFSPDMLSRFTEGMLDGCMQWLDYLPDTVHRLCDLLVAVVIRNGEKWRTAMLNRLIDEIETGLDNIQNRLNPDLAPNEDHFLVGSDFTWIPCANSLTARLHLFTLLFEEMKLPCAALVESVKLVPKVMKVLELTVHCLKKVEVESTPKWLPFLILFLDIYEKAAWLSGRKAPLLMAPKRVWKWFEERSGKWSSYTSANNKVVDDAYLNGEPTARFTAGRRHYTVHFNNMVQINEETGNYRAIMLVVDEKEEKDAEKKKGDNRLKDKVPDSKDLFASLYLKLTPGFISKTGSVRVVQPLTLEEGYHLVLDCLTLISIPVDSDTLHAVLRLCLRLTSNYSHAVTFTDREGPKMLLNLTQSSSFPGFTSLITLIFRHILEDSYNLTNAMEKVIRSTFNRTKFGYATKELHNVFRFLGPVSCREPNLFCAVAKNSVRIAPSSKREDEDNRYSNPRVMLMLKFPVIKTLTKSPVDPNVVTKVSSKIVGDLLNALAAKVEFDDPAERSSTTSESSSVYSFSEDDIIPIPINMAHEDYSDSAASLCRLEECKSAKDASKPPSCNTLRGLILDKSAVCRILAELVKCYPQCAKLIAEYKFHSQDGELITESCTALSFILDNLIHQGQTSGDKDTAALARVLICALASCNHCQDAQAVLVSEVKAALQRTLLIAESSEKHSRLQALTSLIDIMIESCPTMTQAPQLAHMKTPTSPNNIVRLLVRKGLVLDLARIPHHLDLSSPHMSLTVNSALKPLETLSRIVNLPSGGISKAKSRSLTSGGESRNAESTNRGSSSTQDSSLPHLDSELEGIMNEIFSRHGRSGRDTDRNASDQHVDTQNTDLSLACHHSEFDMCRQEVEQPESSDSESNPESCHSRCEDVNREDRVEDDEEEEEDDDEASHFDVGDEYQDIEDAILRIQDRDDSLVFQLEEVFPSSSGTSVLFGASDSGRSFEVPVSGDTTNGNDNSTSSLPPAPRAVATSHPLLIRQGETPYNVSSRVHRRQHTYRSNMANHAWHMYTGSESNDTNSNRQPNTPAILQRLLGPATAQDLLQWSNFPSASASTRVLLPNSDVRMYATDDDVFEVQEQNPLLATEFTGPLSCLPSTFARWSEEARVLVGDNIQDCVTSCKPIVVKYLEGFRDAESAERKEKRRKMQDDDDTKHGGKHRSRARDSMFSESSNLPQSSNQTGRFSGVSMEVAEPASQFESNISSTRNRPNTASPSTSQDLRTQNTERLAASIVEQVLGPALSITPTTHTSSSVSLSSASGNYITAEAAEAAVSAVTTYEAVERRLRNVPPSPIFSSTSQSYGQQYLEGYNRQSMNLPVPLVTTENQQTVVSEMLNRDPLLESESLSDVSPSDASNRDLVPSNLREAISSGSNTSNNPAILEPISSILTIPSLASSASAREESVLGEIPEGCDPSFLAALPDNIRQEVVSEQLRLQRIRQRAQSNNSQMSNEANSFTEVSPEFLAALPPNIQEEVLAQQRAEQQRLAAVNCSPDSPVDPTSFIQTLPQGLRQQVLADMDDSLLALLPAELASEAHSLRREVETRRRQIQERLFTSHAGTALSRILRSAGRVGTRYTIHTLPHRNQWAWNTLASRSSGATASGATGNISSSSSCVKLKGRQLLDHEALACLLVLLFVDDPHIQTTRLHRVLRNLCHHGPTRQWVIRSLLSILERTKDYRTAEEVPTTRYRYKRSSKAAYYGTPNVNTRADIQRAGQPSWLSISLDAALGCRTNVFQIRRLSIAQRRTYSQSSSSSSMVTIHPLASPVVCRHVFDTLISLARTFPSHFLPEITKQEESIRENVCKTEKTLKGSRTGKNEFPSSKNEPQISAQSDCDFWDVLLRLDAISTSRKGKAILRPLIPAASNEEIKSLAAEEDIGTTGFENSALAQLINLLAHPVVKRSSVLTDSLLRLLSLISIALPEQKTGEKAKTGNNRHVIESPNFLRERAYDTRDTMSKNLVPSPHKENAAVMKQHLKLAVEVLTSKTCSEDGLEDATGLLLRLSRQCVQTRQTVLFLLLEGARELGSVVCQHIRALIRELKMLNAKAALLKKEPDEKDELENKFPLKGVIQDRFTNAPVIISAPTKVKAGTSRELQLLSMSALTSKVSSQFFFLRVLKVIIQLQEASQKKEIEQEPLPDVDIERPMPPLTDISPDDVDESSNSSVEIIFDSSEHVNDPCRNELNVNVSHATVPIANESQPLTVPMDIDYPKAGKTRKLSTEENPPLSEILSLENLWVALGDCLVELAETSDHHAVLVLQPAVEAFFLVHSSGAEKSGTKKKEKKETKENQVSHINQDIAPLSPLSAVIENSNISTPGTSAETCTSSFSSNLSSDTLKFLKFAETHRTVLNQVLRQSTTPLTDGPFSVLVDHTRVLDFDVKRKYFRQELERMDEGSRREDLAVHVKREHVFEDSFRELHRRTPEEWKNRFYIVFEGEEGQDAGGLLREWYTIISREIFNPMYALFTTSPGDRVTYMINSSSHCNSNHLSYFKFVGRVIAKAVYDNKLLESYFTRSFYKHILGKLVKYTDMECEDYSFYQGLVFLLEHTVKELGYELTFSVEVQEFGVTEIRDLKPNGRNVQVTENTKNEYVRLVCQEKMTGAIRKQLHAFLDGFYEIIPKRLISIFNEQELELLISGLPSIDIDDLRSNTEYHKYQTTSLQIQWFWRALRSFDQADRANFLQFVTGTSKVPLQGFSALEGMNGTQKFQIHRDDRSTDRLPSAHTCFNQLDLPAYETYDKLRSMLVKAIHECSEGFGFA